MRGATRMQSEHDATAARRRLVERLAEARTFAAQGVPPADAEARRLAAEVESEASERAERLRAHAEALDSLRREAVRLQAVLAPIWERERGA